jgi:hypothetical protein
MEAFMKDVKKMMWLLPLILLALASCAPQKGAMEEQTGGTDTSDSEEYTEFAAKGIQTPPSSFIFVIQMEGNGDGQVTIDDVYSCNFSDVRCEVQHKGPNVVLKASYDVSKYFFAGFKGVACLPAPSPDANVCNFTLENNETIIVATFNKL